MTRRNSRSISAAFVCLTAILLATPLRADPDPTADPEPAVVVTNTTAAQPVPPVVYVDQTTGNDLYSGRQPASDGTNGPKKTICGGLQAALADDVVVVRKGAYAEDMALRRRSVWVTVNGKVDLRGKRVVLSHTSSPSSQPVILSPTNSAVGSAAGAFTPTNLVSDTGGNRR